jgi:choline transport protein
MLTYCISITCVLYRRLNLATQPALPPARWSLGRWGPSINVLAILYSGFVFFWSFWPVQTPVDPESLNWAIVIFGGVFFGAVILFWAKARKVYTGPVVDVEGYQAQ